MVSTPSSASTWTIMSALLMVGAGERVRRGLGESSMRFTVDMILLAIPGTCGIYTADRERLRNGRRWTAFRGSHPALRVVSAASGRFGAPKRGTE